MKKLAITSVIIFIALCGFIAVLCFLPGGNCCGGQYEGCEMREGKSSCAEASGDKCSGKKENYHMGKGHHEGCGKGQGGHDGCGGGNEKCMMKEWKDADGKMHKEVKVIVGGTHGCVPANFQRGCPMDNGAHSGCCGCCPMKQGSGPGNNCCGDSAGSDSVKVKIRGKL